MIRAFCAICALLFFLETAHAQSPKPTLSVLDFGETAWGKTAAEMLRDRFRSTGKVQVADADLSRSAAMGVGYSGSLNLSVSEARDLGAALATDYYLIGDAQTLRRSSSVSPVYYESYCSVFLVSSRSGRLLRWDRPSFAANNATKAEELLAENLSNKLYQALLIAVARAEEDEQIQRTLITSSSTPLIEEAPDDEKTAAAQGLRLPRPYRRLRPEYPESAARAEAEATVDVLVDVGADGEVGEVQVVRWAGFGLDEATISTIKGMHFFPAMRNGTAIPMRVLLRYNFRKPPR
ncbi:MAG TPA: energy transducer TonB [Pyrinomonadaceae bacterium]|nr:energy transducer TonB [Pyrinomonadaceae bacterium]